MRNRLLFFLFILLCNRGNSTVSFPEKSCLGNEIVFEKDTIPSNYKFNGCLEIINLTELEANSSYLYWASDKVLVQNNYQVPGNYNITMKAGNVVVLKPKTKIVKGSKYLARIEPCSKECDIEIQKGISPNGDGLNDDFDLSNSCPVRKVKIFNRYGVIVFEGDSYKKEWQGQDKQNNALPAATYYFRVDFTDGQIKTGWIYLNK